MLWWAPLAVDLGTDLMEQHEDYLLINDKGDYQEISWWDAYYLCPGYEPVLELTKMQIQTIMGEWGFDGLKIDGQHLNAAPPCYNPAHNYASPEEAYSAIMDFYKVMYETATSINPDAVVEICPCGTAYNFFMMPFINQPVSSDPESSWQIRLKGKTFKALMGPHVPYYGDHVELSDSRNDHASTVGIGGVLGSKFTWPGGFERLTGTKQKAMSKWLNIYYDKMLPYGEYLGNLYDIGYDKPETHAIKKDGIMYYALYARRWNDDDVELRGLEPGVSYTVYDYVDEKDLGTVTGPVGVLEVSFQRSLLLEVKPQ